MFEKVQKIIAEQLGIEAAAVQQLACGHGRLIAVGSAVMEKPR